MLNVVVFFGKIWIKPGLVTLWALSLVCVSNVLHAQEKPIIQPDAVQQEKVLWSWHEASIELNDTRLNLQKLIPVRELKSVPVIQARLLWLPSEYGVLSAEKKLAEQLARYGIESWFVDLYEPLFLSPTPSAVDEIPTEWLSQLIGLAQTSAIQEQVTSINIDSEQTKINQPKASITALWVVAANKAGQLAVRGLQDYQKTPQNHLGLILLNPNLYLNTPQPGEEAQYWPQVAALNLPVSILQAELSPWRWRVMTLADSLEKAGSDVFVHLQLQTRDRFYFRPDTLPVEQQQASQLADKIRRMLSLQLPYLSTERHSLALKQTDSMPVEDTRSVELQAFKGEQNRPLNLMSTTGQKVSLENYKGKVVLLNFWASWCPPCVHEMPSMARLKSHYANKNAQQDFEILAVNLGEDSTEVEAFLKAHPVNFPVLLDEAAIAVKDWKVFAYPSSYLIDKKGQVRLALFGATEWDAKQHLQKIETLLNEKSAD